MKAELILKKIKENWFAKCICIIAAILLYAFGSAARLEKRTFSVPLIVKEDGNLVRSAALPNLVNVTVIAEDKGISSITSSDIVAVLDLSYYTKEGIEKVPVHASFLQDVILEGPVQLSVYPDKFSVKLEERTRKSVPVVVPTFGNPLHGYEVSEITTDEQQVVISGPRSLVENINQVATDEINISEKKDDFSEEKKVRKINRHIEVVYPTSINVDVKFQTSLVTKSFPNCQVFFGHLDPKFEVTSKPEVTFSVSGAELVLEKFYPSEYTVQVDCSEINLPGDYELPVVIAVQDAFKLESQSVNSVKIHVQEKKVENIPQTGNSQAQTQLQTNSQEQNKVPAESFSGEER